MSANVLLNLLNSTKHFILCGKEFNKFNNTGASMSYSIYHLTLFAHVREFNMGIVS